MMGVIQIRRPRKERHTPGPYHDHPRPARGLGHLDHRQPFAATNREALKHSHHGALDVQYDKDEEFVRVTWTS